MTTPPSRQGKLTLQALKARLEMARKAGAELDVAIKALHAEREGVDELECKQEMAQLFVRLEPAMCKALGIIREAMLPDPALVMESTITMVSRWTSGACLTT